MDLDADDPKRKEFVKHITDEQDGDLALSFVSRLYDVYVIAPEVI